MYTFGMEKQMPKVAVNVFVIKDGMLLLGKRKKGAGNGFWALPGGHLEFGESLIVGAKRELEEETGLTARVTFENMVNDYSAGDGTHYVHINFLAHDVSGAPEVREPEKCYEWKWFLLDVLPENIFIGHRRVIPAFLNKTSFVD